jgi:hypothetical protein
MFFPRAEKNLNSADGKFDGSGLRSAMQHPYTRHGAETPQPPRSVAACIRSRLRRLRARVQAATKKLTRYMQRIAWQRQGAHVQTPWIPRGSGALPRDDANSGAQGDASLFIGVY